MDQWAPGTYPQHALQGLGGWTGARVSVAFGEGDAPWPRIFEAAESVGGIEQYYLEQEIPGPLGELAMVEKCLENYRRLRG